MSSIDDLHRQLLNPALSTDERARIYCQLVKQLQQYENYEAALEVMDKMWPDVLDRGKLEQLEEATRAEALLRVGAITSWVGDTMRIEGAQDTAKDKPKPAPAAQGAGVKCRSSNPPSCGDRPAVKSSPDGAD